MGMIGPRIFFSYVLEDRPWADQCARLMQGIGASICSAPALRPPEEFQAQLQEAVRQATHTLVLIGPRTRLSKYVDLEIELSAERRDDGGPGAGVVGIILPSHEDFTRPYYDPQSIPLRLHDLIQNEYAILRKWTDNPGELERWLEEAERRRRFRRPEISLGAAAQIYRFAWDASVDEALADPQSR